MATVTNKYFFMKVGKANRMLAHLESLGGLWFGYPAAREKAYLAEAAESKNRQDCFAVIYGRHHLNFFKVKGQKLGRKRKDFRGDTCTEALEDLSAMYSEYKDPEAEINILEVEQPGQRVERSSLVPFIDSLSVYQGLNRGTFRAFAVVNNGNSKGLEGIPSLIERREKHETPSGTVIRLYFDAIRGIQSALEFFRRLTPEARRNLVLATLNPGQMETAAMLMFLDLDMTPLVGVAKGLDVVDLRMSVDHYPPEKRSATKREVRTFLENAGVANQAVFDKLEQKNILDIQCKAYSQVKQSDESPVLRFEPFAAIGSESTLALSKVQKNPGKLLGNWLDAIAMRLEFSKG